LAVFYRTEFISRLSLTQHISRFPLEYLIHK